MRGRNLRNSYGIGWHRLRQVQPLGGVSHRCNKVVETTTWR
jgi:hypothetical protein